MALALSSRRRLCIAAALGVFLILVALRLVRASVGFVEELLPDIVQWTTAHRFLGAVGYSATLVTSLALFMPTTPLEVLAGYMFGFAGAAALLLTVKPLALLFSFFAARKLGLRKLGEALGGHTRVFQAVEYAIQKDPTAAWQIVFLVCMAYLPCGVKVYGLAALPSVRPEVFIACAAVAGLPFCLVHAWLGNSATDLSELLSTADCSGSVTQSRHDVEVSRCASSVTLIGATSFLGCLLAIGLYGKRALERLPKDGIAPRHSVVQILSS